MRDERNEENSSPEVLMMPPTTPNILMRKSTKEFLSLT